MAFSSEGFCDVEGAGAPKIFVDWNGLCAVVAGLGVDVLKSEGVALPVEDEPPPKDGAAGADDVGWVVAPKRDGDEVAGCSVGFAPNSGFDGDAEVVPPNRFPPPEPPKFVETPKPLLPLPNAGF